MNTHNPPTTLRRLAVQQVSRFWFSAFGFLLAALQLLTAPTFLLAASQNPPSAEIARAIADGAGEFVRQTPPAKTGPVYVFEENHASLRGQMQIATMLTRLHKRYGLQIIGLEGSVQADKPLPTKSFVPGRDPVARQDALRRMLADGEISGVEYVGAVNPGIEIWGLEKKEEYDIKPPDGVSPSFVAIVGIAEKLLSEDKLTEFVQLVEAKKIDAAIKVLKDGHPWIREQLDSKPEDNLQDQVKRQEAILKKAKDLNVELPDEVKTGIQQTIRFYQVADRRSETMTQKMAAFARRQAGEPTAMVIGAAHTDRVMQALATAGVQGVLLRPKNLLPSTNDSGLNAFENKVRGLWANDSEGSFGSILNKTISDAKPSRERKPPPRIGDLNRQSLGSLEYVTSAVAQTARGGQRIPADLPDDLRNLPGGVSIDPNSFSQDGYDVIFCVFVDEPGKARQRIWVRTGTVRSSPTTVLDSKEGDMTKLAAADNEPPRKPPTDEKATKSDSEDPSEKKKSEDGEPSGKNSSQKNTGATKGTTGRILLADAQTRYKAFATREEARSCPMLSSQ